MKTIARAMRWLGKRLSIVLFPLVLMGRKLAWPVPIQGKNYPRGANMDGDGDSWLVVP